MKKLISILVSIIMLLSTVPAASAHSSTNGKALSFNSDGSFKIVVINDYQDVETPDEKSIQMLNKLLDTEKPDLVVFNGDQLSDSFPNASLRNIDAALNALLSPLDRRGIPFLFSYGNHDCEKDAVISRAQQAALYYKHSSCYAAMDGYDSGTYNVTVSRSDGKGAALNIYIMDTGIWNGSGTMGGVTAQQVEWYRAKSDELKASNGGVILPSLLFQHMPVKETYKLLAPAKPGAEGAVQCHFSGYEDKWYTLDQSKVFPNPMNSYLEDVCCEHPDRITGEYEAWVEKGDILCAVFGHDHLNNFFGRTEDGIVMGYNAGFGFNTYGKDDDRGAGVFEFNENDLENYSFRNVTYDGLMKTHTPSFFSRMLDSIRNAFAQLGDFLKQMFTAPFDGIKKIFC